MQNCSPFSLPQSNGVQNLHGLTTLATVMEGRRDQGARPNGGTGIQPCGPEARRKSLTLVFFLSLNDSSVVLGIIFLGIPIPFFMGAFVILELLLF